VLIYINNDVGIFLKEIIRSNLINVLMQGNKEKEKEMKK
jgi:hypothetical protein